MGAKAPDRINWLSLSIATIGVAMTIFFLDWFYYGAFLYEYFQDTATVWRPQEEIISHYGYAVLAELVFAFFFCLIFIQGLKSEGSLAEGIRFGLYMGGLVGISMFAFYVYMPIPLSLALLLLLGCIIGLPIAGLVAAFIYRKGS